MMTLPLVNTAAKTATASTNGAAADATDIGTDIGGAATADGAQTGNAGFLSLLGNKLLTLAQQGQTALPASATAAVAAADDKNAASPKAKLNALLAALDKPETLNSLLQSAKTPSEDNAIALTKTQDDSETAAAATPLSSSDMQALQALFAMLPQAQQQPTAALAKGGDSLTEGNIKGSNANATLASLLASAGGAKTTAVDGDETAKDSDSSMPLSSTNTLSATAGTQKGDIATLNSAFQQVLGQVTKDSDKDSAASQTTITPGIISAASVAVTPATTSLVSAPATPQLSSQLGSPEWQQALGQQIVMFSRNGQQTAELHLHPLDLGSIQISLKLDSDQAQLSMVSNHSQVRAALEAAMPQLKEALAQSGINLGQTNVSSDAQAQSQSFSGQQEQRNNSRGNTFSLAADADSEITPIAVPASLQARASGSNAVDIFA